MSGERWKMLAAGAAILVVLLAFAFHGGRKPPAVLEEDEALVRARVALEGIRARKPADRRPVGFDDLMGPLGDLNTRLRDRLSAALALPDGLEKRDALEQAADLARRAADLGRAGRELARELARPGQEPSYFRLPELEADACLYEAEARFTLYFLDQAAGPAPTDADRPLIAEDVARPLREVIERGLSLAPNHRQLLRLLGQLENLLGFYAAAESALERVLALHPDFAEAWGALGISRYRMHDYPGAEEAFVRARDLAARSAAGTRSDAFLAATQNLATLHRDLFHRHLAGYRAGRVEERAVALRHREQLIQAAEEYVAAAPPGDPHVRALRDMAAVIKGVEL